MSRYSVCNKMHTPNEQTKPRVILDFSFANNFRTYRKYYTRVRVYNNLLLCYVYIAVIPPTCTRMNILK